MENVIIVGIGGFFGANARYALTVWTDSILVARWGAFPYGTLAVNVIGSFGLAVFGAWFSARTGMSPQLRLLVGTGFFGAFTTFSTFANESIAMLEGGGRVLPLLNLLLNNGCCLFGVALGLILGHKIFGLA